MFVSLLKGLHDFFAGPNSKSANLTGLKGKYFLFYLGYYDEASALHNIPRDIFHAVFSLIQLNFWKDCTPNNLTLKHDNTYATKIRGIFHS